METRHSHLAVQARQHLSRFLRYLRNAHFDEDEHHLLGYNSTRLILSIRSSMDRLLKTESISGDIKWWWDILNEDLFYMDLNCQNNPATMLTSPRLVTESIIAVEVMIDEIDREFPYIDSFERLKSNCEMNIDFHDQGGLGAGDYEFYRSVKSRVTALGHFESIRNWASLDSLSDLDDFLVHVACMCELEIPRHESDDDDHGEAASESENEEERSGDADKNGDEELILDPETKLPIKAKLTQRDIILDGKRYRIGETLRRFLSQFFNSDGKLQNVEATKLLRFYRNKAKGELVRIEDTWTKQQQREFNTMQETKDSGWHLGLSIHKGASLTKK